MEGDMLPLVELNSTLGAIRGHLVSHPTLVTNYTIATLSAPILTRQFHSHERGFGLRLCVASYTSQYAINLLMVHTPLSFKSRSYVEEGAKFWRRPSRIGYDRRRMLPMHQRVSRSSTFLLAPSPNKIAESKLFYVHSP